MVEVIISSAAGIMLSIGSATIVLAVKLGKIEQHLISHDGQFTAVREWTDKIEEKVNGHIHDHLKGL
ncbi:hypothetical protein LCGC14_1825530 [marine sediment metagenome]|uniref:Uncharacterized protein n=1 Tax=marine sediment metagenome TaxID=412755 RepID=A0A0F9GHV2_9ZZZZ